MSRRQVVVTALVIGAVFGIGATIAYGRLQDTGEREIPSAAVGEAVMERLKALDPVAYVRFASVYREFRDVGDFVTTLEGLTGKK